MKKVIQTLQKRKGIILALVAVGVVISVGVYLFEKSQRDQFATVYAAYDAVATSHDAAAFFPSVVENTIRKELNRVLAEVLVGDHTAEERLELAKQGLVLLEEAENQIDVMGDLVPEVEQAIEHMQQTEVVFESMGTRDAKEKLIALAQERITIIADIRGLSYRANHHTAEIFNRIIEDGGELTDAHTVLLNKQVPLVEEQFDSRSNLYVQLQNTRFEMEGIAGEF